MDNKTVEEKGFLIAYSDFYTRGNIIYCLVYAVSEELAIQKLKEVEEAKPFSIYGQKNQVTYISSRTIL